MINNIFYFTIRKYSIKILRILFWCTYIGTSTYAVTFLLSLYLQYIRLLSPQAAGTILLAQPLLMAVTAPFAGKLSDRIEPRVLATAGMTIVTFCLFLLSFIGVDTPLLVIVMILMVLGLGYGIFSSPNMNSIMSSVENKQAGIASATAATMRVLGQNQIGRASCRERV